MTASSSGPSPPGVAASSLLRTDHREIEALLDALAALLHEFTAESIPEVRRIVNDLASLSQLHFAREEGVYYPHVRRYWPSLLERFERRHEEIRGVENQLLESIAADCSLPLERCLHDVKLLCGELVDRIQHHIVEEEDELFRLADERLLSPEQERLQLEMKALSQA